MQGLLCPSSQILRGLIGSVGARTRLLAPSGVAHVADMSEKELAIDGVEEPQSRQCGPRWGRPLVACRDFARFWDSALSESTAKVTAKTSSAAQWRAQERVSTQSHFVKLPFSAKAVAHVGPH